MEVSDVDNFISTYVDIFKEAFRLTKAYVLVRSQVKFTIEILLQMVLVSCFKEVIFPRLCLYFLWVFWRLVWRDEPVCRGSQFKYFYWFIFYPQLINSILYISQDFSGDGILIVFMGWGIQWLHIRQLSFQLKSASGCVEWNCIDFAELDVKLYEDFSED